MNRIIAWSVCWGVVWGAYSGMLMAIAPDNRCAPIVIIVIGMAAGGLNMLASLPAACAAFLALTILSPAAVAAITYPAHMGDLVALCLFLSTLFLALTARRNYLEFLGHLRLRLGMSRLADEAETASRAKSRFLANMSHELRTPLNAIVGFAEMIREQVKGPIAPHYVEFAGAIDQSGRHLVDIINDILDLSKIQAGTHDLDESVTTIGAVIDRAAIVVEPACQAANMRLAITKADDLPQIYADPRRLTQVLINLLSNAVKFSHANDCVKLDAFLGPARPGETTPPLMIRVTDTGIGIPADEIQEVLKPFVQSREAERRQIPGTGLGLPLADEIMRLHGGTLTIESEPGHGTVVVITLPPHRLVADVRATSANREIAG
jgi:signal transduction histidine kinase